MAKIVALGVVALCFFVGCSNGGEDIKVDPEAAVVEFDGSPEQLESRFSDLNQAVDADPAAVREVGLAHLSDADDDVRYAAVYAVVLTTTKDDGVDKLVEMLKSDRVEERLTAAGQLLSLGDVRGFPVLIDSLSSEEGVRYWDPPAAAFEWAKQRLLFFTSEDFGLQGAVEPGEVVATQPQWREWWEKVRGTLHWDETTGKFVP